MTEWLRSFGFRLRARFGGRQLEQDLQDEVAFHLAMREDQLRRSGQRDARARAHRRFGSATRVREDLHDAWAIAPAVGGWLRDLGYSARTLGRNPGFSSVVVLTLALGIGATTAFFSVVNAVLFRPLGYRDADRLVSLNEAFPGAGIERLPFSALDFDDLCRGQQSFEAVAAYRNIPFEISGEGQPEQLVGAKVSAGLFPLLGVRPVVGRTFSADDDRPGADIAILSWGLWHRRHAADPAIVGQRIQLDRRPHTVIGVMPAGFVFPRRGLAFNGEPADVWVPMAFTDRERGERATMHTNSVVARLKNGVALQEAAAELGVLGERIAGSYPAPVLNAGFTPHLSAQPIREEISGRFERPFFTLLAAVALVLLVACANVANLLLSRSAGRMREFAVRSALGARRRQLGQLLLSEAVLLSGSGGAIGLAMAYGAVAAAPGVLVDIVPGLQELTIDLRVLAFAGGTSLATAILFTLAPLVVLTSRRTGDFLRRASARATAGRARLSVQRTFVVVTVSASCVLLIGASVLIRSFASLMATDVGFRPAEVLTAATTLPRSFYATAASVRTFHASLVERLTALSGVRSAALATDLPLTTYELRAFTPEPAASPGGVQPTTNLTWVHGPFFETLGMTLRGGRFFADDEHSQNRGVVIVTENLAALAWPGQDPVGKRLKWGGPASGSPWLTVVGVIGNVADGPIGTAPKIHAYEPFRQMPDFFLNGATNQFGRDVRVVIRATGDPRALAEGVRQTVRNLDAALAVERVQAMDDQVKDIVAPERFGTLLLSAFATMSLLLASVGLYGLLAFSIEIRRKEIAVRMALGAERRRVMGMVIGEGARLLVAGLSVGLLASVALMPAVNSLLHRLDSDHFGTFVIVPAILAASALLACTLPAWRAAEIEPNAALRTD